jgi:hypothetical protein
MLASESRTSAEITMTGMSDSSGDRAQRVDRVYTAHLRHRQVDACTHSTSWSDLTGGPRRETVAKPPF